VELTVPYIESLLQAILPEFDAFIVDVGMKPGDSRGQRRLIVRILIDTDAGITIGQCAEVSRKLGAALDAEPGFDRPYELEVSSPGIDRPLTHLRQYRKNVGRRFRVALRTGDGRTDLDATLASVEGESLTFRTADERDVAVRFIDIIESKEVLPW